MYDKLEDQSEEDSRGHQAEDCENLLSSSDGAESYKAVPRRSPWWHLVVAVVLSSLTAGLGGVWIGRHWIDDPASTCAQYVSQYSPIIKDVDTTYHLVTFDGSFMHENVFRLQAGPEVDAAWESLGINYLPMGIPAEEAVKSGIPRDAVQINQQYGGGYPANVEGLHHLHCLNLVRQALYYNIDYYRAAGGGAFKNNETIVQLHVSHCLDIVRQRLMCAPDTGLLGQVWWDPEDPSPFVDFNTQHKCKNYEAIRQWAEVRQLPDEVAPDFLQPPQKGDRIYEHVP